jgi:hypothetical protein
VTHTWRASRRANPAKEATTMKQIHTRMLAGVAVPDTPVIGRAIEYAREKCEPYLFNHVMRSWLFAIRIGEIQQVEHDPEVLAVGTLLHDLTLNEDFAGPRRFEVEAADLARSFARGCGFGERHAQLVWDSVALNSTASIGLYKEAEVALCTAGICLDVIGLQYALLPQDDITRIVDEFPRLEMKRRMSRCFCQIAETHPETTYDNFVRDFGMRFVGGYKAVSATDLVNSAPFAE